MTYKLGSLFDGSGGFPLAGSLCNIEPVWASEVEPYPIAVTRERFPNMKHLGDISKVNGADIEPVDILCAGSPCQDLSVAGLRKGLKHEANGDEETTRSGLFMEFVRIIKEMRTATNGQYPRFALWENVPGAFSSNKGEDFRIVCEELIKIVEPSAFMPPVPQNGWSYADSYVGDGWSLAYRVFDAQYWGVPQRRRRIHLVADFGGECAREVLFEREGVRGYFAEDRKAWQTTPGDAQGSAGADDREGAVVGFDAYNQTVTGAIAKTLTAMRSDTDHTPVVYIPYTLKIRSGCEGGGKGALIQENKSATLATNNDQYLFQPVTLATDSRVIVRRLTPIECARLQGFADWWGRIEPKDTFTDDEFRFWLEVRNTHAAINGKETKDYTKEQMLSWYNKLYTESAEYKMWGNGIALPTALYVMQGISDALNSAYSLTEQPAEDTPLEVHDVIAEDEANQKSKSEQEPEPYEITDLSDAPEEIKAEIVKNAELLNERDGKEEITEEQNMETNNREPATIENVISFDAVEQLKRLADERKALANLKPENTRFSDDVRAIEYAIGVMEAVGL